MVDSRSVVNPTREGFEHGFEQGILRGILQGILPKFLSWKVWRYTRVVTLRDPFGLASRHIASNLA